MKGYMKQMMNDDWFVNELITGVLVALFVVGLLIVTL